LNTLAHFDPDSRLAGIGGLLLRQRLDVTLAVLVDVIDDPGFLQDAVALRSDTTADGRIARSDAGQ
jgi:hypothetical protein